MSSIRSWECYTPFDPCILPIAESISISMYSFGVSSVPAETYIYCIIPEDYCILFHPKLYRFCARSFLSLFCLFLPFIRSYLIIYIDLRQMIC